MTEQDTPANEPAELPKPADLNHRRTPDDSATASTGPLTERERDVLAFAQLTWRYAGAHENAISERFGWTTTRYFQVLNALLDRTEALEYDPMLINRLRRLRDERLRARSDRTGRREPGGRRATE